MKPGIASLDRLLAAFVLALLPLVPCPGQEEPETAFRVEVVGGVAGGTTNGVRSWTVTVPPPLPEPLPVEVEVVLVSRIRHCSSHPTGCNGEGIFDEISSQPLCANRLDDDGDGLTDSQDPECDGVSAWSMSVATDECFGVRSATTRGTIGDLNTRPPGLRDPEGGFEKTELVDPRLNGGQEGVVSAVAFSFARPIVLPHTSEGVVLKLHGRLLAPGGEGEGSHPCLVRILEPGEPGLRGSGEPVMTVIAAFGETYLPAITSVAVSVVVDPGGSFPRFLRGDADDSGDENITDGVYILRFLFRGGTAPACLDAADADDSGGLEITDAVRLFNFLFLGGSAPPRPGPGACGPDPTPDALACASFAPCAG